MEEDEHCYTVVAQDVYQLDTETVTASDDICVTVNPEINYAPEVSAGSNYTIEVEHDGDPDTDCVGF